MESELKFTESIVKRFSKFNAPTKVVSTVPQLGDPMHPLLSTTLNTNVSELNEKIVSPIP